MDLKVELQKLAVQVLERKSYVVNEEMTKQALIIPFLQKLGYDVFNPLEVRPEYVADFGIKKGEKVDYAIFKNGSPIIFIEAKAVNENLDKHSSQLSRYFNAIPEVKIAILTNGNFYKFYTDLTQHNIMDNDPFFTFSMETLSNTDIETIESFTKDQFESDRLVKFAEELVYVTNLNSNLKELFRNPSDEFLRFLIKDFSSSRITTNVLDRFRPIVKKAINNTLLEIISEGLAPREAAIAMSGVVENSTLITEELEEVDDVTKKVVVTTDDELKSFEIIKEILNNEKFDVTELKFKDTTHYFSIFNRIVTKWFIRVNLNATDKHIITRLKPEDCANLCPGFKVEPSTKNMGESRIRIQTVEDIKNLQNLVITCFKDVN